MNSIDWMVFIGGITAIGWINWYFFLAQPIAGKEGFQKAEQKKPSIRETEATFSSVETNHH